MITKLFLESINFPISVKYPYGFKAWFNYNTNTAREFSLSDDHRNYIIGDLIPFMKEGNVRIYVSQSTISIEIYNINSKKLKLIQNYLKNNISEKLSKNILYTELAIIESQKVFKYNNLDFFNI